MRPIEAIVGELMSKIRESRQMNSPCILASTSDMQDLLAELGKQTWKAKNPNVTALWGKPMSYWIRAQAYLEAEAPYFNCLVEAEGKVKELEEKFKIMEAKSRLDESIILDLVGQSRALKQKLLELGGCPNANS